MMLSDILAERENQIHIKEELHRLEKVREQKYHEMMRHNHECILEREENERIGRKQKKHEVAKVQKEQLQEAISRKKAEIKNERIDGFALRMAYQKQIEDDDLAAKSEKDRALRALNDSRHAQKYLLELKERARKRDAEQDIKIEEYAHRQEEIEARRRERQRILFDEKLKIRQKMIDTQAARLAEIRDFSDKRTEQECREVRDKMDRLDGERREYQSQLKRNMEVERKNAIERRDQARLGQKETEKIAASYTNAVLKKLEQRDHEREICKNRQAQKMNDELMQQIREKLERHENELDYENAALPKARELEEARLHSFTQYAESVIREYAAEGRNIVPMVNSLKSELRRGGSACV